VSRSRTRGIVFVDDQAISVRYRYIDASTIEFINDDGVEFLTHYKSLVIANAPMDQRDEHGTKRN
jgi:hypothetical protein